jgi:hypothetical protein
MTLYIDYSALQSNAGRCALAYAALRLTGRALEVVYTNTAIPAVRAAYGQELEPPVLVTDDGQVIHSLPEILSWARRGAAFSA